MDRATSGGIRVAVSQLIMNKLKPGEKEAAQERCFKDCSTGVHLDPEAGCVSVCGSPTECEGWVPYLGEKK